MPSTLVAVLIVVLRLAGSGQGTALEDGVRAMLRGDHRAAARALRPLSSGEQADPAAQFLMAVLLLSPKSTDFNLGGACGLFAETAQSTHVLAQPALEIADAMRGELGPAATLACVAGLPGESIPASFTLGPSHTVEIFLPLRDVTLRAPTGGPPLYFVQLAYLEPSNAGWDLRWALYQIARGEVRSVAMEGSLAHFAQHDPPDPARVDLGAVVNVHLNASGLPECTVQTSAGPRSVALSTR
jgi:hypothetical protein